MTTIFATRELIQQKIAAFEQLEPEFEESFQFVQDVHGQKRFPVFAVADIVRYLHGLWICELKGRLLSAARTVKDAEGKRCLGLLRHWQEDGAEASVVAFLHHKLDMLPLAELTHQLQQASVQPADDGLIRSLRHGRMILLNRGMHLMYALDALFSLSEEERQRQVAQACSRYGHLPAQTIRQEAEMETLVYSYRPHPVLAQRNMVVMNKLGVSGMHKPADVSGHRSWHVLPVGDALTPFAEYVIIGYQDLTRR